MMPTFNRFSPCGGPTHMKTSHSELGKDDAGCTEMHGLGKTVPFTRKNPFYHTLFPITPVFTGQRWFRTPVIGRMVKSSQAATD
jgi:hypothetical protein